MARYVPLSVIRLSHEVVVLPLSILHDSVALVLPFVVGHIPCIVQIWRNKPLDDICKAQEFPVQAVVPPVSV